MVKVQQECINTIETLKNLTRTQIVPIGVEEGQAAPIGSLPVISYRCRETGRILRYRDEGSRFSGVSYKPPARSLRIMM